MKLSRKNLAVLVCTAALGLGACGGGDSWNGETATHETVTTPESPAKLDPEADSPTSSATSTDDDGESGGAADDGDAVTASSPGGAISLTASALPLLGPDPKITVTWEAEPNAGDQCLMILTRTDPRGYLLGVEEIDDCSGTHEFGLVAGVAEDADDVAGDHVIEMDNLDEKATLRVTVSE